MAGKTPAQEQPKEQSQDQALQDAQREVESYGRDPEAEELVRSLGEATEQLSKGGAAPPSGRSDKSDDDEEDKDDDDGGDDEDDEEDDADSDDEGDDEDDDAPPPPPAKDSGKDKSNMKRSRAPRTDQAAADALLKSLLLDEKTGRPTPVADVIEVSDVLTELTDTIAKSYGDVVGEIGTVQLQLDQVLPLLKAMGKATVALARQVRALQSEVAELSKAPATQPMSGLALSMNKRMPNGDGAAPRTTGSLTKSMVSVGLQVAFTQSEIDAEMYRRAASVLDSQGIDAALKLLPDGIAGEIRKTGA